MEPSFIARYRGLFEKTWADDIPVDRVRFVVLDSETTGLDPRHDRLITIGAVGVSAGEIQIDDSFDALIRVDENTSAVAVHGVPGVTAPLHRRIVHGHGCGWGGGECGE